jgi:MFS family permease
VLQHGTSYLEIIKGMFMVKNTFLAFILVVNVFSWYFPLYIFLRNTLSALTTTYEELLLIFGVHYLAILLSAIIGTELLRKILSQHMLLSLWMLLGGIFSLFMIFLEIRNWSITFTVSILVGIALGLGYPSCLAYFKDSVNVENEGRIGGIMFFAAFLGTLLVGFLTSILSFVESVLVYALWRISGFLIFQIKKDKKSIRKEKSVKTSYKLIISEKSFILYLIPWTMFCVVNFFAGPWQEHHWESDVFNLVMVVEFGVASVASLIGGYFADIIGRRRIIILGYVLLGIGYAALSIFPDNDLFIGIYALFDGISWGLFLLMFLLVIWGDIAGSKEAERYYLLGTLPFLISSYIWVIVAPFAEIIYVSTPFSIASFFLFLAVTPLMFAPETLPERKLRERELKEYVEKAKKIKEKYV